MSNIAYDIGRSARIGLFLVAAWATACSGQGPLSSEQQDPEGAAPVESSSAAILAQHTAVDGSEYAILETESGELVLGVGTTHALETPKLSQQQASVADLYEALSGQVAPESVRAAERKLSERKASFELLPRAPSVSASPEFDRAEVAFPRAVGESVARSSEALTLTPSPAPPPGPSSVCNINADFVYCLPDTTGNPWFQISSSSLHFNLGALGCAVRFRYRYYENGSWHTLVDRLASQGSSWHYYQYGKYLTRRVEVLGNSPLCHLSFIAYGWF